MTPRRRHRIPSWGAAVLAVALVALLVGSAAAEEGNCDAILGRWLDSSHKVEVEIFKAQERYAGRIIWLKEPNYRSSDPQGMGGKPRIDRANPDPSKRHRPLMHMNLFWNAVFAGKNTWNSGYIYDPMDGRTYRCVLSLEAPNTLKVRGFVGIPLLGKTIILKRSTLSARTNGRRS